MTVVQAIAALLYDHDTVIVPALGAFVRHDESAQVNVITNEFQKPSSTLEFDPSQREENPLVIEYLMEHDGISDEEARQQIAAFVAECYNQMREGQPYALEGVGTLTLDSFQELVFEPDATADFNADAFGLDDLEVQPVFGDTGRLAWGSKAPEKPTPEKETPEKEVQNTDLFDTNENKVGNDPDDKGHRRLWWLWLLIILIILGGGGAWWYFKFMPTEPEPIPPVAVVVPTDNVPTVDSLEIPEPIELPVDSLTLSADSLDYTLDPQEPSTDTVAEPEPALQVVQPELESKAFIIGGCFGMEEYALNMANAAIEQGCAEAFVMKRGSKYYVAYGQYPTTADAKEALPDIIANYNKKAWILNK